MNKYLKQLLIILGSLILAISQISFFCNFNVIFLFLIIIIILILYNFNLGLNMALYLGLFIDFYNLKIFGLFTITLLLTGLFINYLFLNYLTHKNFLTYLLLIMIGFLFFNFIFILIKMILIIFGQSVVIFNLQSLSFLLHQGIYSIFLFSGLYFIFIIVKRISRRKKYV